MRKKRNESLPPYKAALQASGKNSHVFRLYVTGTTRNSLRAIENTRFICQKYLEGRFELEVIDIYQQPCHAREGQIIAAPTLVKECPLPMRKFIGDMAQTERILLGLGLRQSNSRETAT